jgi:hypothetical protein
MSTKSILRTSDPEVIFSVPVPQATNYYRPVSNRSLHQAITGNLNAAGFNIEAEQYSLALNGQVCLGVMRVSKPSDYNSPMHRSVAFLNSYNKTKKVTFTAGAMVRVCSNGVFLSENQTYRRKHSGSVNEDLTCNIMDIIEEMDSEYNRAMKLAEQLQQIEVNYDVASTFVGDAYLKNLLSPHMMASFLESIATNKDFAMLENRSQDIQELKGTAWQLYNNATEALKRSVPSEYVKRHADLSNWFVEEMGLEPTLVV